MPRHGAAVNSTTATRDDTKAKQWAKVAERREARELEECNATIKTLKDKIEALRKNSNSKEDYDASTELKSLKSELKDEQKKVARAESQLAEAVAAREALKLQLEQINDKLKKLPPPDANESSANGNSDSSVNGLTAAESEEVAKLEKQIVEQETALAEAEARCKSLQSETAEKAKQLEKLSKSVTELEEKKEAWEKELKALREGKEGHAKKMDKLAKELDAEQKSLDRLLKLDQQAEAGKKELKDLSTELRPLSDRVADLQASHKKLTDEAEAQNTEVTKARADLKIYRSRHSQVVLLEKELSKLVEQDKALADDCNQLKLKLDKEKADSAAAEAELAKVKARMASSQQQLESLEKTIAELEETKQEKQADEAAVEAQVASLLPEITASHARSKALQAEYDRVSALCVELEQSNATMRAESEQKGNVTAELEQSRAKVDTLLQQLNSINAARAEQEKAVEQLKREEDALKEARAKTERLRKELDSAATTNNTSSRSSNSPGFLSGWTRSIWGQDGSAATSTPSEQNADAAELLTVEKETEEWKEKAQQLEKTLAELTKARDENSHPSRPGSSSGTGPTSTRPPSSVISDGFEDSTATSAYVPDQRTQTLLAKMKDTIAGLKEKIHTLQAEENTLRAENTTLLMELAGA